MLAAIQAKFFAKFRVSVMFDSNGSNTTASAAATWLATTAHSQGKRAGEMLAGTGPGGQRAAGLLAREGAQVAITGRKLGVVQAACESLKTAFRRRHRSPSKRPPAKTAAARWKARKIVLATGRRRHHSARRRPMAATPHLGVDRRCQCLAARRHRSGIGMSDRGVASHGKLPVFGPLGLSALKLAVHRACIARLFEQNDLLLDAAEISTPSPRAWSCTCITVEARVEQFLDILTKLKEAGRFASARRLPRLSSRFPPTLTTLSAKRHKDAGSNRGS